MSRKRKRFVTDAVQQSASELPSQNVQDAFSNPLARLGFGTPNLMESTQYIKSGFTSDYQTMTTLYRENWVVKRLIDVVPEDILKNWYEIKSSLTPDQIKQFKRLERTTNIRKKLLDGFRWGRLYGGAAALMVIDGHEDILDKPLELDMVMPDAFKGLLVLDRWSGISPSSGIVRDFSDPDFGLPEYYDITAEGLGYSIRVHHSRILRFPGRPLPHLEEVNELYWGTSEIEHVMSEIKKYDNTSYNIAMLVFSANLKVYRMVGMEQVAMMNQRAQSQLYDTLCAMNWMMSNQGMQVIGEKDSFETKQYTFSGISDVYELFMLDLAGAAEMPVTKLFGRSPAGMNATGESDMQNYYDSIEEKQESFARPVLDRLLPVMMMSEFGAIPDDWELDFNSCRRPTEEEKKNIALNTANAVVSLFNAGIVSQRMALEELRAASSETGMWDRISDEDIERADDSYGIQGELPPNLTLPEGADEQEYGLEENNRLEGQTENRAGLQPIA